MEELESEGKKRSGNLVRSHKECIGIRYAVDMDIGRVVLRLEWDRSVC